MPVSSGQAAASNQPPLPDAAAEPLQPAVPVAADGGVAGVTEPASPVIPAIISPVTVSVVSHNPITHAVEVRPQVSPPAPERCEYCGDGKYTGLPGNACENCMNTGLKYPEKADLGTDHISEIFVGARRLPQRELPADFQQRLLAAIESDEIWQDEPPLFLRSPTE
jgi:hypothetical protein